MPALYGKNQKLIRDIREHIRDAVPYNLTFAPCGSLSNNDRAKLEAHLKYHFELWARSWITPWVDKIEKALCKSKKGVGEKKCTS